MSLPGRFAAKKINGSWQLWSSPLIVSRWSKALNMQDLTDIDFDYLFLPIFSSTQNNPPCAGMPSQAQDCEPRNATGKQRTVGHKDILLSRCVEIVLHGSTPVIFFSPSSFLPSSCPALLIYFFYIFTGIPWQLPRALRGCLIRER